MKFYIGVTDDPRFHFLACRIREKYENGRVYYPYQSQPLTNLPERITDQHT